MRIFTTPKVMFICRIMMGTLILYGLWTIAGSMFICIPVASFWDKSIKGHCMNKSAFYFSNSALNIATDIIIFAFPMPLLKQLHLPRQLKIELMFVFGFGCLWDSWFLQSKWGFANSCSVCVTSIIRLKSLYLASKSIDAAVTEVGVTLWSGVEINVAIASSSLPALKPLLARIVPGLRDMTVTSKERPQSDMSLFVVADPTLQPHQMRTLHRMSQLGIKWNEIQVQKEIFQKRNSVAIAAGTFEMGMETNCYSESLNEELRTQHSHESVWKRWLICMVWTGQVLNPRSHLDLNWVLMSTRTWRLL